MTGPSAFRMTLNLIKLSVGSESVDDLRRWQSLRAKDGARFGAPGDLVHTTFQTPRRQAELLEGGSLYWVIKGLIQARQRLTGFKDGVKEDGSRCCLIVLDPELVSVRPTPRRAFQGWRYLTGEAAPPDCSASGSDSRLPPQMLKDLTELGLL